MPMNARPRRSALIRTRLDSEQVLERLRRLAADAGPEAAQGFFAQGHLVGGRVGAGDFHFDYHIDSPKNPQTYAVHGTIQHRPDWRLVRLKVTAHDPWLGWWAFAFAVLLAFIPVLTGEMGPWPAVAMVLFVLLLYGVVNLFWVPDMVTDRVAALLARALRGSTFQRGQWVVPPEP